MPNFLGVLTTPLNDIQDKANYMITVHSLRSALSSDRSDHSLCCLHEEETTEYLNYTEKYQLFLGQLDSVMDLTYFLLSGNLHQAKI